MITAVPRGGLPGISRAIRQINERAAEFAGRANELLFLTGEPGTERALLARGVHELSGRSGHPFVRLTANWKLPPDFSEQLASASGGTVFVNLLREFQVDMQYTFLELAMDRTFTDPLSGDSHEADVRLVLTTTLDLQTLFARSPLLPELRDLLMGSHLLIPPLRERREDIPALVRYALQRARETGQSKAQDVDRQVLSVFRAHIWPGNAEELLLVAAQAALKAAGPVVTFDDLPEDFLNLLAPETIRRAKALGAGKPEAWSERARLVAGTTPELAAVSSDIDRMEAEDSGVPGEAEILEAMTTVLEKEEGLDGAGAWPGAEDRPGEDEGSDAHPAVEGAAAETREMLRVASRLYAQSALLARQMQGPLPPATETAREIMARRRNPLPLTPEAEEELTRGLEEILTLRRQLAILNQRERDSALTIRDLLQRLELAYANSESEEVGFLSSKIAEIDAIVERITERLPKISEDLQSSIRRLLVRKQEV